MYLVVALLSFDDTSLHMRITGTQLCSVCLHVFICVRRVFAVCLCRLLCWQLGSIVYDGAPFCDIWGGLRFWMFGFETRQTAVTFQTVRLGTKDVFFWLRRTMRFHQYTTRCVTWKMKKWRPLLCVCLAVKSHFWSSQLITLHHSLFVCLLHCYCYLIWGNNEAEAVFVFNGISAVPDRFQDPCFGLFVLWSFFVSPVPVFGGRFSEFNFPSRWHFLCSVSFHTQTQKSSTGTVTATSSSSTFSQMKRRLSWQTPHLWVNIRLAHGACIVSRSKAYSPCFPFLFPPDQLQCGQIFRLPWPEICSLRLWRQTGTAISLSASVRWFLLLYTLWNTLLLLMFSGGCQTASGRSTVCALALSSCERINPVQCSTESMNGFTAALRCVGVNGKCHWRDDFVSYYRLNEKTSS